MLQQNFSPGAGEAMHGVCGVGTLWDRGLPSFLLSRGSLSAAGGGALRAGLWKRDMPGRGRYGFRKPRIRVRVDAEAGNLAATRTTCRAVPGRSHRLEAFRDGV